MKKHYFFLLIEQQYHELYETDNFHILSDFIFNYFPSVLSFFD